jgi:hypothetical protein
MVYTVGQCQVVSISAVFDCHMHNTQHPAKWPKGDVEVFHAWFLNEPKRRYQTEKILNEKRQWMLGQLLDN